MLMRLPCFLAITLLPCFVSWATAQKPSAKFKRRDRNNDHRLTSDELRTSPRKLVKSIDTNGDGIITAAEDIAFFKKTGKPTASSQIQRRLDINYAGTDNPRQTLDLFLPLDGPVNAPPKSLPIIVWIHGGGWQNGNKKSGQRRLERYVGSGQYVGASIHYRLSGQAQWPTQLHDCKAAIRWLMANAESFGGKADKIIAMGSSAGGHLVSMLALTHGVRPLEGTVGPHRDTTARVTAAVNFYGPTDLLRMNDYPSRIDHDHPNSPESRLIGGAIQENQARARTASPVSYVDSTDAPMLHLHGTADRLVPYDQSVRLHQAMLDAKVESYLITVTHGGHGRFLNRELEKDIDQFIEYQLRGAENHSRSKRVIKRNY